MAYYESEEDITPPVRIEPCVTVMGTNAVQLEPLVRILTLEEPDFKLVALFKDHLVKCIQLCVVAFDEYSARSGLEAVAPPPVLEEARCVLNSLVERMIRSDPEDFLLVSGCEL